MAGKRGWRVAGQGVVVLSVRHPAVSSTSVWQKANGQGCCPGARRSRAPCRDGGGYDRLRGCRPVRPPGRPRVPSAPVTASFEDLRRRGLPEVLFVHSSLPEGVTICDVNGSPQ